MKEITQIENRAVEIWRRPYQRSLRLSVRPDGSLRVTCGRRIPLREITRFVLDSHSFIEKSLQKVDALKAKFPAKQFLSGEPYLFFGERLRLEMVWTWAKSPSVQNQPGQLEMLAPVSSKVEERQKALHQFYRKKATPFLKERLEFWARQMKLEPKRLSIRGQRTRWGSCSASGQINLNWKLLAAPPEVIDYVVIHELAHLVHMNHSARFWQVVERFCPDFNRSRTWLRRHEFEIGVQFR